MTFTEIDLICETVSQSHEKSHVIHLEVITVLSSH